MSAACRGFKDLHNYNDMNLQLKPLVKRMLLITNPSLCGKLT